MGDRAGIGPWRAKAWRGAAGETGKGGAHWAMRVKGRKPPGSEPRSLKTRALGLGVSPRGSMSLYRAAQGLAFLEGRPYCIPDDFKRLVLPVFAHRIVVSSRYVSTLKKVDQAEAMLSEIVESTPIPL